MGLFGFETSSERIAREAEERENEDRKERELVQKRSECEHDWYETSETRVNVCFKEVNTLHRCYRCGKEEWW